MQIFDGLTKYQKQTGKTEQVDPWVQAFNSALSTLFMLIILLIESMVVGRWLGPIIIVLCFAFGINVRRIGRGVNLLFNDRSWDAKRETPTLAFSVLMISGVVLSLWALIDITNPAFLWPGRVHWHGQEVYFSFALKRDLMRMGVLYIPVWMRVLAGVFFPLCIIPLSLVRMRANTEIAFPNMLNSVTAVKARDIQETAHGYVPDFSAPLKVVEDDDGDPVGDQEAQWVE